MTHMQENIDPPVNCGRAHEFMEAKRRAKSTGITLLLALFSLSALGKTREAELFRRLSSRLKERVVDMADLSDIPEVMDIRQASQYLGISRETLYKYLNEDLIPAFRLGNRWRLKKTVLDRWMESESSRCEAAQLGQRRENPE